MKMNRICSVFALAVLSSSPIARAAQPAVQNGAAVDAQGAVVAQPNGDPPRPCLQTGSRIPSKDGCVNAAGQVVTREELESTGSIDVGDALRRTVPSVH